MIRWEEVSSSDRDRLETLARELSINPLALEDCYHRDQRAKLDDYENHQFLVWFMYAKRDIYELQFLIFPELIIMVTHEPPPEGTSWKEYFRLVENYKDVWHMLYHVLDRSTDITWSSVRALFNEIDDFEEKMFSPSFKPQDLMSLKKQINQMDFSLGHLSSVSKQLQNLCRPKDDLHWKLRDLHDHCERIDRSLTLYRSQIDTTVELYWGLEASRTNNQIKKLSILASIAVPLTLWASFWGMNFEFIPFDKPELFYVAIGLMVVTVATTTWFFIKKGYWS